MKRSFVIAIFLVTVANVHAVTIDQRKAAAEYAAGNAEECLDLSSFYWTIGDATGMLVEGAINSTYIGSTRKNVASASKWLYSAYVAEKYAGGLTAYDIQFLTLSSGYESLDSTSCSAAITVNDCLAIGDNGDRAPGHVGVFYYNGGHFEVHAVHGPGLPSPVSTQHSINLGTDDDDALANEINGTLGLGSLFEYTAPVLASGMKTSADDYSVFLRAIMNNQLQIGSLLGSFKVCTVVDPDVCPTSKNSPVPGGERWHYSLGHWVEDDPITGPEYGEAYSSPGGLGFYPWITTDNAWYGIVFRDTGRSPVSAADANDDTIGWQSVECGRVIREAWLNPPT